MRAPENKTNVFQKVGECLYRYSPNGVYYARIKVDGKEIRQSLGTTDRKLANRNLANLKKGPTAAATSNAARRPQFYLNRSLDDFLGTWDWRSRSCQCDTVVGFARAAR